MRICHFTPHLPPDQAANALLPFHLGWWAHGAGHQVCYVAHPPSATRDQPHTAKPLLDAAHHLKEMKPAGPVTWIPRREPGTLSRVLKVSGLQGAIEIIRRAMPIVRSVDLVHVHSNGLLAEVGAMLAAAAGKPYVLTLYGTEIWHYRRKTVDLFARAYRRAAHVTFYSHGLQSRALELGLRRRGTSVIYPPVAGQFVWKDGDEQAAARAALGIRSRHLLVNVKRLHPLAGQKFLIQAMGEVIRTHPDTKLVVCGTGALADQLKATAREAGAEGHVTFAGLLDNGTIARYDQAADLFVLPSLLEACPTVALEALACGTPVLSSDNPGGVELHDLFGVDVAVVPREDPYALAGAIVAFLDDKRRARASTREILERQFTPDAVWAKYLDVYRGSLERAAEQQPGTPPTAPGHDA